jgi:ribosomal protein L31
MKSDLHVEENLINFSSGTNETKKLEFSWKLPEMVQIQICKNPGSQRKTDSTKTAKSFTCKYHTRM